ncbi:DUF421 domain-containing protein [Geothrix sp. 21YS21S-4]|uniref:DUF421 domain-containing protein n=1 Tax=Geothrix sp. 21YS21S-4 TaxID=3068889 RepID=UPI0027B9558D|nr:YetF domain-containing protein [Geothrix sp. 21YS21S-4]
MPHFALLDGLPVAVSMWKLNQPWWEFILRGVLVYGFLLLMLRLMGKREVGQMATFDLVLLLILSNAVQNSMNAGDNTVLGGFLLVGALMGLNVVVSWLTWRSKRVERVLEGGPRIVIHHGVINQSVLDSERITHHELMAAVRRAGLADLEGVRVAILETNGQINVIPKEAP